MCAEMCHFSCLLWDVGRPGHLYCPILETQHLSRSHHLNLKVLDFPGRGKLRTNQLLP